jgi:hypothetical protein
MNIKYSVPTCKDTAVCMCFFSPAGFQRPKQNFLHVEKLLQSARIPTFTIECIIGNKQPLLKNPTLQVRSNTSLFYKEQLYNLLVPKVPEQYTKLIFLDADILFSDPRWIDKISVELNRYDIVQPFENAIWTGLYYGSVIKKSKSTVYALKHGVMNHSLVNNYHPGFSFAMTRSYYEKIGGFFDKCVFGSGDSMFCNTFFPIELYFTTVNLIDSEYKQWSDTVRKIPSNVTYLPFTVYHLYHGTLQKRQYASRYEFLKQYDNMTFDDIFYKNEFGVYETNDDSLKKIMYDYFVSRQEDEIPPITNLFGINK